MPLLRVFTHVDSVWCEFLGVVKTIPFARNTLQLFYFYGDRTWGIEEPTYWKMCTRYNIHISNRSATQCYLYVQQTWSQECIHKCTQPQFLLFCPHHHSTFWVHTVIHKITSPVELLYVPDISKENVDISHIKFQYTNLAFQRNNVALQKVIMWHWMNSEPTGWPMSVLKGYHSDCPLFREPYQQ